MIVVMQCLVVGEITCERLIVVLNKIDMFEEEKRASHIAKVMELVITVCYYHLLYVYSSSKELTVC